MGHRVILVVLDPELHLSLIVVGHDREAAAALAPPATTFIALVEHRTEDEVERLHGM